MTNKNETKKQESESNNQPVRSRSANTTKKKTPIWRKTLRWFLIVFLVLFASGVGLFAYYAKDAPSVTKQELQSGGSSGLYSREGKFIVSLGSEKRNYVNNAKIPQKLKDAVISVEDRRFYSEKLGVDPIRIVSSALGNIKSGGVSSGGSTITQQLVKLTKFPTYASNRNLRRKAQEAWLSMKVERQFTKDEILEFYINKVYMNYGNYGMGTASQHFYGKPLSELNLAQTALIAGMPNAPVTFDPYVNPEKAKSRRDIVLLSMLNNKKISKSEYDKAKNIPITDGLVKKSDTDDNTEKRAIYDPYIKEVISDLKKKGYDPYNDNLKITVNMDPDAQKYLYNLVNDGSVYFSSDLMQVGATVVNPKNGDVVAMIGGRNLPNVQLGLNRAVQSSRSSGSTIKPVLDYAPAIEYLDWSTHHQVQDTQYTYPGTNIQLYDWDNTYLGPMSMRYALAQSRNVPAVKTLEEVGISRASLFAKKLGIDIPSDAGLSVGIGAETSSLNMAGAFGAFANEGVYHKPSYISKIETADGETRTFESEGKRVMKESTAYMITDMLKDVLKTGSGTTADIPNLHHAGKTGSVKYADSDLVKYPYYRGTPKDAWFNGYTRNFAISIWTGYDQLKDGTITGQGEYTAQVLYRQLMSYLMRNKANKDWEKPSSVIKRRIIPSSNPAIVAAPGGQFVWELFVRGSEPASSYSDADYNYNPYQQNQYSQSNQYVESSESSSSSQESEASSSSSSSSSSSAQSSSSSSSVAPSEPSQTTPTVPNEKEPTDNDLAQQSASAASVAPNGSSSSKQ